MFQFNLAVNSNLLKCSLTGSVERRRDAIHERDHTAAYRQKIGPCIYGPGHIGRRQTADPDSVGQCADRRQSAAVYDLEFRYGEKSETIGKDGHAFEDYESGRKGCQE